MCRFYPNNKNPKWVRICVPRGGPIAEPYDPAIHGAAGQAYGCRYRPRPGRVRQQKQPPGAPELSFKVSLYATWDEISDMARFAGADCKIKDNVVTLIGGKGGLSLAVIEWAKSFGWQLVQSEAPK